MFASMIARTQRFAETERRADLLFPHPLKQPTSYTKARAAARAALPGKVDVKNMVDLSKPRMMFLDIETWEPSPMDPLRLWPCIAGIDWLGQTKPGATTGRTESSEAVYQRLLKTAQEQWASLERGTHTGRWSSGVPQVSNTPGAGHKPAHGGYPDAKPRS